VEFYSAINNEMMPFGGKWMEVEIMLNEISQCHVFCHLWKRRENKTKQKNQGHEGKGGLLGRWKGKGPGEERLPEDRDDQSALYA
jgi:hypothetical protein